TGPNPKAPQRSAGTPFPENMPYIDAKFPGNSYLLYKIIIGMGTTPQTFMTDQYSCNALVAAGYMALTNACMSTASLTSTPPVVARSGEAVPAPVEPWVPDDQSKPAADGEDDRLHAHIRGTPMPYTGGKLPREQARTLSAWIAAGAATNNCP